MTINEEESAPESSPVTRWDPASDPDGVKPKDLHAVDWALEDLMDLILGIEDEREDSSISLTVISSGLAISGQLISGDQWADSLQSSLADVEGGQSFGELFSGIFHSSTESNQVIRDRRKAAGLPNPTRSYIHLRDVRMFTSGAMLNVAQWRGRLSEISGWNLGGHNPND